MNWSRLGPQFQRLCRAAHTWTPPTRKSTVAYVGSLDIGSWSAALADRLLLQCLNKHANRFVVHDPSPFTLGIWAEQKSRMGSLPHGSMLPTSLFNASKMAATIYVHFQHSDQVKEAFEAPELGLLEGIASLDAQQQRTLVIDCTTWGPASIKRFATRLQDLPIDYLNAIPMTDGLDSLEDTEVVVSGPTETVLGAAPWLQLLGKRVTHCSPSIEGASAVKLVNNLLFSVNMTGTSEAMLLGARLGLPSSLLANIINSSSGASHVSQKHNPVPGALPRRLTPADRDYYGGLPASEAFKDLHLALEEAGSLGIPLKAARVAQEMFSGVQASEWASKDASAVYQWLLQRHRGS